MRNIVLENANSVGNERFGKDLNTSRNRILFSLFLILFILFNTVKLSVFNFSILYSVSKKIMVYKLALTAAINIIIFVLMFMRKKRWWFITFYVLETIYIIGVITYSTYLHGFFHISQLLSLGTEGKEAASKLGIKGFLNPKLMVIFMDAPFFAFIVHNYKSVSIFNRSIKKTRRLAVVLSILLIAGAQVRDYNKGQFITQKCNDPWTGETFMVERYGTLVNGALDLFVRKDKKYLDEHLKYGQAVESSGTGSSKPNFVIIQVESMSANIVNEKHNGQYVTPFLHSLEDKSVYYPYLMSYHKGGGTSDAEYSVINSVEPLDDYAAIKISGYDYPNSFVKSLKKSSYDVIAFHGNEGSYYNRNVAFSKMGFDKFNGSEYMGVKQVAWGLPDKTVLDYTISNLKQEKKPFLAYTITMTSHTPFNFAEQEGYKNNLYDDVKDDLVKGYLNSFSYVDQSIKEFVNNIRSNFHNTYIIIYGDHTPGLDKSEYKSSSVKYDNKYFEFVPLFILTPDNASYKEEKKVGTFLDIAPTVLNASGQPYKINTDGNDLLNMKEINNPIHFKGADYSRTDLYSAISNKEKEDE